MKFDIEWIANRRFANATTKSGDLAEHQRNTSPNWDSKPFIVDFHFLTNQPIKPKGSLRIDNLMNKVSPFKVIYSKLGNA